ncbi:hypothetical protein EC991_007071, partial [Linnemannia zychae]
FESTYFKYYKDQPEGPQDRCHERGDELAHEFFVAIDVPSSKEYASYKDSSVFLDVYDSVPEEERCFFEQIREGKACKEYYDIDWTLASSADEGEIKKLEQQVFTAFLRVRNQHAPEFALDNEHCRVFSSSNSKKLSLHIVIPTMVFENNNLHMKAFILRFQETWKSALCDKDDAALLKRIDMGVYSKNRNMRILGSHKFLDPTRPLQRAEWHFLITAIGPDSIKITSDLQVVAVERAPSTVTRKTREAIQSCSPKYIVDAVRAKFEQTPHAAQFFDMQCVADRAMIFRLDRKIKGFCEAIESTLIHNIGASTMERRSKSMAKSLAQTTDGSYHIIHTWLQASKPKPKPKPKPNKKMVNIVLVHGAFADGSSWSDAGHTVTAVQQPLSSIDDDVAKVKVALAAVKSGPIVLVGHSFGGLVISHAAIGNTNISSLVYVAAFALDKGESVAELGKSYKPLVSNQQFVPDSAGKLALPQDLFVKYFAPDVEPKQAKIMAAAQGPCDTPRFEYVSAAPAWRQFPNYYVVAEKDQIIQPEMQAFFADRMKAKKTLKLPASHAVPVSHAKEIAALILEAAAAAK